MNKESKICQSCGRTIEWRKKWEKDWDQVKYCSQSCKSKKNSFDFKADILKKLNDQKIKSSICPSDILPPEQKQNKEMMEHVRRSARLLAHDGQIEITQGNKVVDPEDFRGPIRLRLKR